MYTFKELSMASTSQNGEPTHILLLMVTYLGTPSVVTSTIMRTTILILAAPA
jgi:hypothetical protein